MMLHFLRLKPMHGYALVNHIRQVSEDLLKIEEGSFYLALQRMLRESLLECELGIAAKGGPTRIFKLTKAGRRHPE
jgi:PadR family transcriptional regulator, regulatory protein PadR